MRKFMKLTIAILCLAVSALTCFACGETERKEKTVLEPPVIASAVYTGEKQTAVVPENAGYAVTTNDGGVHAGDYDVALTLTDAEAYEWKTPDEGNAATVTLKFTITKADNEITALTIADRYYGDEAAAPVAIAKFGTPAFTYSASENGEYTATVPTAAGKYFVKAAVEGTNDYAGAEKVVSFEIKKQMPEFTTLPVAIENLKYDGSAHALVTAGETAHGTLEYRLGADDEWSATVPSVTDAGAYSVYYRIKGDDAHGDLEAEAPISVTVAKADVRVTAPAAKTGLAYTGEAQELITAGATTAGTMQYKVGDGAFGENIPAATNAGTYTVAYKVVVDGNHNEPQGGTVEVVIAKANVNVTAAPTAKTLTYNGEAQELINAGTVVGGKMQYKVGDGAFGENIPTATNAGTYTVEYRVVADDNHNAADGGEVEVTIAKVDMVITHPTAKTGLVYNGDAQEVVNKGSVIGGKIEFFNNADDTWSENPPTKTNAGNYQYRYRVVADKNHNEITEEYRVSFKIAKMSNSVKFDTASMDVTYPVVPAPKATATFGEIIYTYATVANKDNAEAYGDWNTIVSAGAGKQYYCKATAAGDNNHESAAEIRLFTVHKGASAISEFELTAATLKCGNALGYTVNVTGGDAVIKYSSGENGQYEYATLNDLLAAMLKADPTNAIGNGFTYWVKAFVSENEFYLGAQSDARSFVLYHDFDDGVCKGCGHAQTGISYGETETEAYVTGYSGNHSTEVYILAEYNGKPVTYINYTVDEKGNISTPFKERTTITKVVLPSSITVLKGYAFFGCSALEYLAMPGVTTFEDVNNLTFCYNLKTLIVHDGLAISNQQLQSADDTKNGITNVYVDGTTAVNFSAPAVNKLVGNIFYKGDAVKCFTWKFDENGEIKTGPVKHNYVDGKCSVCGVYMLEYAYDSANESYYVKGFAAGVNEGNVVIVEKYNDGTNGEHPVTYVAANAFANKTEIRRVIMPSVTDLGGMSFFNCQNLEYVDMRGVTYISYANKDESGNAKRPDGSVESNNNFLNCFNLKTVIVGNGYRADAQQFATTDMSAYSKAVLYVNGTSAAQMNVNDRIIDCNVYYLGNGTDCLTWCEEDGEIKTGPKHTYGADGKCTLCQTDSGVEYAYDSTNKAYYVKGLKTGVTVQEVVIVEKYNDGTNGEHPVTYVAANAFANKTEIRRVIMPSVTDLGGMSFFNCQNLEYVDMRGVTYISYANKDESGNAKRPDGSVDSNNNFLNCFNLKTVIVGNGYRADAQQFVTTDSGQVNKADLYVYGTDAPSTNGNDKLLTGKVYYYSESKAANAWHYEGGIATLW